MADQKVRITQLPTLNDGDDAVAPVNKNNVDYKFSINNLLQVKNNLSEVDAGASRANLGVYSKDEIDEKNKDTASGLRKDLSSENNGLGDSLIAVKQPFTNSTARTQHDKNSDVFHVKDFGAVGDGVTDDRSAIIKAISYASSLSRPCRVMFSGGVYAISNYININGEYITLDMEGSKFIHFGNIGLGSSFFSIKGSFNKIINGCFDGGLGTGPIIWVDSSYNTVSGNYITGGGSGIQLDGQSTTCIQNKIQNNIIRSVTGFGVSQNSASYTNISGNIIDGTGAEGITVDNKSHFCIINGNHLLNTVNTGGVGAIGLDAVNHCSITGNFIFNSGGYAGIRTQNNIDSSYYVTITGNVLEGGTATTGIHLYNNTSSASGSGITTDCVISGNAISDYKKGVVVDLNCVNNVVSGNRSVSYTDTSISNKQGGSEGICFSYMNGSPLSSIANNNTYTVTGTTKIYDKVGSFNGQVFTAPRDGVYNLSILLRATTSSAANGAIRIVTTPKTYESPMSPVSNILGGSVSIDVYLTSGQTAEFRISASASIDIAANALVVSGRFVG